MRIGANWWTAICHHYRSRPNNARESEIVAEPLFVTDEELLKLTGMPRETLALLDRERAFPKRHGTVGNKRHWDSVKRYLDFRYGSKVELFRSKSHDAA